LISEGSVVKVAKICGADSKQKFFLLDLLPDFPDEPESCRKVYIDIQGTLKAFIPEMFKQKHDSWMIRLQGIDVAADKFLFLDRDLYLPAEYITPLDPDLWLIKDLIGSRVMKNGALFGTLDDVYRLGPNDVYAIKKADGEEYMLPALKQFIKGFDSSSKVLTLTDGEEFYED